MKEIKIFISMPMRGKTEEEIKKDYESANTYALSEFERTVFDEKPADYHVTTVHGGTSGETPLKAFAKSLMILADCDYVYFHSGYDETFRDSRGCSLEHKICKAYGVKILNEHDEVTMLADKRVWDRVTDAFRHERILSEDEMREIEVQEKIAAKAIVDYERSKTSGVDR